MQEAVLEIDLKNIQKNLSVFRSLVKGKKICAVVKANAYGHGAERVALSIERDVDFFAVSTIAEGESLRFVGVTKEILVLTPPLSQEEALRGAYSGLTLTIGDEDTALLIHEVCLRERLFCNVHLKVNTGMNRYGFSFPRLKKWLSKTNTLSPFVEIQGIYSHFYESENEQTDDEQLRYFLTCAARAEGMLGRKLQKHIAATGGCVKGEKYHLDAVRIGLGLYGYLPWKADGVRLFPAMRCFAPIAAIPDRVGDGCGYGRGNHKETFTARFGYGDGLRQKTPLFPNGRCMDATVIEGKREKKGYYLVMENAEETAKLLNTSPYEILCSFSERVERKYVYE